MGTRSRVAVMHGNVCKSVYCHYDGYLSYTGEILNRHYDSTLANALVSRGDNSGVKETLEEMNFYSDRGETDVSWQVSHTFEEFLEQVEGCGGEYYYVNPTSARVSGLDNRVQRQYTTKMMNTHRSEQMYITFTEGWYNIKGQPTNVGGMTFKLVEDYKVSKSGEGYVTVEGGGQPGFPDRSIRIKCRQGDYNVAGSAKPIPQGVTMLQALKKPAKGSEVTDFTQAKVSDEAVAHETDEEIIERTRLRFEILKDMTKAVKGGDVRAMIVTGPPGVGKSFGVEEVLSKDDLFNTLGERKPRYEIVKGAMSAIGLYSKLYQYSDAKNILVFDDCDSILLDDIALNILKAALDSSKKRTISWNTDSRLLRSEGIPDKFEFKGGAIFITNLKFENVRSKKLQEHLAALESRCHYIDLRMDTDREKVLRIKQIVKDGMLDSYELEDVARDEVVDFIETNRATMRELSLRTVLKVADLRKSFPTNWQNMAKVTVMKGAY